VEKTAEEELIYRYFEAFNSHDTDGVMACFHEQPAVVDLTGSRYQGVEAVRRFYADQFSLIPDGRCELRSLVGNGARGMAESLFHGARSRDAKVIKALGVEVFELVGGRIKEVRDYHRLVE
jgi:hypothetical protein